MAALKSGEQVVCKVEDVGAQADRILQRVLKRSHLRGKSRSELSTKEGQMWCNKTR